MDRLTTALKLADLSILSVGSGDGSQQAAIVTRGHRNITTTFFPSREEVLALYPAVAAAHLRTLEHASGPTLFGVDGTKLHEAPALANKKFDIVLFTFPHTGVPQSGTMLRDSIASNKALIEGDDAP